MKLWVVMVLMLSLAALPCHAGLSTDFMPVEEELVKEQKPAEAEKEGISSILSVPIVARGKVIGILRIYTTEPWEFTLEDVNFVQAMGNMAGMAIEMSRQYKGLKDSIEILKTLRNRGN